VKIASLFDEETRKNPEKLIETMKSNKHSKEGEKGLFEQDLEHLLDQRHELYKLGNTIPWERFEVAFDGFYSDTGRPAKAIRQMVGLLLVKQLKNVSDEEVCRLWRDSPYVQYFCGEQFFQWGQPCNPSDLVHFRNRIGEKGVEEIFKATVYLHREKIENEDEVVVDTTVQEANVTHPTDIKLRRKIIEKMWKLGEDLGIKWDPSYKRKVPHLLYILRTRSNRLVKDRRKAEKKVKTYAGRLIREFERKADRIWIKAYEEELDLYKRVLSQKRHDKNKVYSLHDPSVLCIGKGKAHKKWEFGRKASVAMTRDSGVIVGAVSFEDNIWDGDTLDMTLIQAKSVSENDFKSALVDRGYQGKSEVSGVEIYAPHRRKKTSSYYRKRKDRIRFARRAAIEPVICLACEAVRRRRHLKNDFRMARCFLKGALGASQNLMLAAAAWNLKKWINESSFCLNFARFCRTLVNALRAGLDLNLQPQCLSGGF
jgi:IS5 family transposase